MSVFHFPPIIDPEVIMVNFRAIKGLSGHTAIVLETTDTGLKLAALATFGGSTASVDLIRLNESVRYWIPVSPAEKEGEYVVIKRAAGDEKAAWVNIYSQVSQNCGR
jgi:hypothetical protein